MKRKIVVLHITLILILTVGCAPKQNFQHEPRNSTNKPPETPIAMVEKPASGSHRFPIQGIPILMYHAIEFKPGNNLYVSPDNFAAQMKFLHDAGFNTISLDELYFAFKGQAILPQKPIVITFDDGYKDQFTNAFPILKQYNFVATFFVITGGIDKWAMTWEQVTQMSKSGMSIESHTVSHPDLRTLSNSLQTEELALSKQTIEGKLGTQVKYFCYPSGKYTVTTLGILNKLGYEMAFTTDYGKVKLTDNLLTLKRIRVSGSTDLNSFIKMIK